MTQLAAEPADRRRSDRRRTSIAIALGILAYLALGALANLHAWADGPGSNLQSGGGIGDVGQSVWFLGFTPHSLLSGRSILTTDWLNAPWGYNLMDNTSVILPAILLAPVTLLLGPIVAFNVAVVLAFAGSATVTMLVLRRWTTWLPAAWAGGLLAAYSPAMAAQGSVHLHLIIQVIPPLVLLLVDEILVRRRVNPWCTGAGIGALLAAQLMISAEGLVSIVVLGAVGLLAAAILRRHDVAERMGDLARATAGAAAAFAVLAAWPLFQMAFGPWSTSGPVQRPVYTRMLSSDLLGFVLPTSSQLIAPHRLTRISDRFVGGNFAENGAYLGIVLIVLLGLAALRWRRHLLVQITLLLGTVAALLSLGSKLHVKGSSWQLPLPYVILAHLPFAKSGSASRYSIAVAFFAGIMLAFAMDRLHREGIGRIRPGRAAGGLAVGLAVAGLIWLIPAWPYASSAVHVPRYFTSGASDSIREGSTVLTYPTPQVHRPHDQAMVWQVVDEMRWRLVGAYGHTRGVDGKVDTGWHPRYTTALLDFCTTGGKPAQLSAKQRFIVLTDIKVWRSSTIVVTDRGVGQACATKVFTQALEQVPQLRDGALVFPHALARAIELTRGR